HPDSAHTSLHDPLSAQISLLTDDYLGHKNIQHTVRYHRNGARPLQEFLALTGGGKLGTASPSITLAFAAASRCAISASIISIAPSFSSSVIALTPPEGSIFSSFGTSMAQPFK